MILKKKNYANSLAGDFFRDVLKLSAGTLLERIITGAAPFYIWDVPPTRILVTRRAHERRGSVRRSRLP